MAASTWHAALELEYRAARGRTTAHHRHEGPLRVLRSLYPEGDAVCHNVLVHPPGGIAGGDCLEIDVRSREGAHGLITTPGATRFYGSDGRQAVQHARLRVDGGARLEWLPLETLAYSGCLAENRVRIDVAPGGELLGWDATALGLPHAAAPFERGELLQHVEVCGAWLERARLAAADRRLLDSPLGRAGQRCLASCLFVSGEQLSRARRERALEAARECIAAHPLARQAGATSPDPRVLVARAVAAQAEPAMSLMRALRTAWREALWSLPGTWPRIWAM